VFSAKDLLNQDGFSNEHFDAVEKVVEGVVAGAGESRVLLFKDLEHEFVFGFESPRSRAHLSSIPAGFCLAAGPAAHEPP
jgi:hypothetical protein